MTLLDARPETWTLICSVNALTPGRGIAALVDDQAVAVFLFASGEVVAIDNIDPCTGASVLSRGLIGHLRGPDGPVTYVASPLRKHRFDLATGRCLDADTQVRTWNARVCDGYLQVASQRSCSGNGTETIP